MAGNGYLQGHHVRLAAAFRHRRGNFVQATAPSAHQRESGRTRGQLQRKRRTATAAGPRGQN